MDGLCGLFSMIIQGESNHDYHSNAAIGNSKLKDFALYGAKYYAAAHIAKTVPAKEPSKALRLGTALHPLALEGDAAFHNQIAISPYPAFQSNEAKAWKATMIECGRSIITKDEHQIVQSMHDSLNHHPEIADLLHAPGGTSETTIRLQGPLFNVQCRPDRYNPKGCELTKGRPYMLDLKTCASISESDYVNFEKNFEKLLYHRQAAWYREIEAMELGLDKDGRRCDFYFAAVESEAPFDCALYKIDDLSIDGALSIELGERENSYHLSRLRKCYETNTWPGMARGIHKIALSEWAIRRSMEKIGEVVFQ